MVCLLAPLPDEDLARVRMLADQANSGTESDDTRWVFEFAKVLVEYRAGRYADAREWVDAMSAPPTQSSFNNPMRVVAHAIVAMTCHRTGALRRARSELNKARAVTAAKMPQTDRGSLLRASE